MLMTRQAQIAVAILIACARGGDAYMQTHEAAAGTGASKEHALKIAHLLRQAGFLTSMRGRYGGVKLAKSPASISLGAVLRDMQPKLTPMPRHSPADLSPLDTIVETGWRSFVQLMDRFTIADMVAGRSPQRAACLDCRLMTAPDASPRAFSSIQ